MNVDNWALADHPLCRPKAAGRLLGTVVTYVAAERRNVVESGHSPPKKSIPLPSRPPTRLRLSNAM